MARDISLSFNGSDYLLGISKVDRKKIYGYTEVDVKDDDGLKCSLATISDDGKYILSKGCVGYATLNEKNEYVASNTIKMVDSEGEPIDKIPSSFDLEKIELESASLDDYLKLHVKAVYQLNPENDDVDFNALAEILRAEKVLKFKFNYRADYDEDDAYLLESNDSVFMVIGVVSPFEFIGLDQVVEEEVVVDEEDEDDFDFGML
jgi:hypothetical protein